MIHSELQAQLASRDSRIVSLESQVAHTQQAHDKQAQMLFEKNQRISELEQQLAQAQVVRCTPVEYNDIINDDRHIQLRVVIDQSERSDGKIRIHVRLWIDGEWKHGGLATIAPGYRLFRWQEGSIKWENSTGK